MIYKSRILLLNLVDAVMVAASVTLAFLLRFDFQIPLQYLKVLPYAIFVHFILILIAFNRAAIYRRVWQYASIGELVQLVKGVVVSEFIFFVFNSILQNFFPQYTIPRSIYIISLIIIVLGVGGTRLYWRMFRDSYMSPKHRTKNRRTLIIGAGSAGVMLAKELKQYPNSDLYPVAFVDDDKSKWKLSVMGMPVLGGREQIPKIVKEQNIEKVIIALPSVSRAEIARIINICKLAKVRVKILPRVGELVNMDVSIQMIREVNIEDLLGRDPVQVDLEEIAGYLTGQIVLVTGAGGSIGSELCRQISSFSPKLLLLLGHGENSIYNIENELKNMDPSLNLRTVIADIQDRQRIRDVFDNFRPAVVFHAAAHKHVPLMEINPTEAVKNNILGTKNVADNAHEFGADRFVMVSTDKAVNPTSIMGCTKRVAEMYIQSLARSSQTKFTAVRFGNVLGSRGSVIPLFKRQIEQGGPVTVTHPEMVRYFMTIPEAVQLVIQAGAFAGGGEVFILDMGKPVKIDDLAKDLIRLSGFEPGIDIQVTYTGVRKGEKLYEEILSMEEGLTSTKNERIFIGKPGDFTLDQLQFMISNLEQLIVKQSVNDSQEVKEHLKQIVPTFLQFSQMDSAIAEIQAGQREAAPGEN